MRIYLGHFCKPDRERELGISVAASNFSNTLVNGNIFDKSYSILPPYVRGRRNPKELTTESSTLLYSFWRRLPSPFCKLAPAFEQVALFFKIPRGASLWLYNVTMLNWILIKLLSWLKPSVSIYPIVLDYTPGAPGNDKFLRFINSTPGRISLTNYTELSKVNFRCLPGITPTECKIPLTNSTKRTFLLSGILNEQISSISTVVDAFEKVPEAILNITGNLSHNPDLVKRISEVPNVNYLGMLSKEAYMDLLDSSTTFILSTRNPSYPENKCNFPSKIIEGLFHNKGIVSTITYPQIEGINYILTGSTVNEIRDSIREIISMTEAQIEPYINQGKKTAEMFSIGVWKNAIDDIERPYDAVYLTNTPSFYKLNLTDAICAKGKKILLVFYGYGNEAVNTVLKNEERPNHFDWIFLHDGDSAKRDKITVFRKLSRLLRNTRHKHILYSGWFVPEYNLYSLMSPRNKNILICESSIYEVGTTGWRGYIKRLIIGRMNAALPSGLPHKELLEKLGLQGPQYITGSVGIFDKRHSRSKPKTLVNGQRCRFLYVGRLVPVKNVNLLVDCFNRNGLPLTIVGDGILRKQLEDKSNDNISFLGFVNNDELYRIYQSHDVFILPSLSEPWGLVVEEALYNGLPVIASDMVGAYPDMVKAYRAGECFRHDSMESLQAAIDKVIVNYTTYSESVAGIDFDMREQSQIKAYIDAFEI